MEQILIELPIDWTTKKQRSTYRLILYATIETDQMESIKRRLRFIRSFFHKIVLCIWDRK